MIYNEFHSNLENSHIIHDFYVCNELIGYNLYFLLVWVLLLRQV